MEIQTIFVLLVCFGMYAAICGAVGGVILTKQNRVVTGWLLGLLLGPLGWLIALVMADKKRAAIRQKTISRKRKKKCPDCAELVLAEARKCRFCGYEFSPKEQDMED